MRHRSFHFVLPGAFFVAALLCFSGITMGGIPNDGLNTSQSAEQADIMQFTAGGHVLGFGSDKVYMVGPGSALIEEFVGASGVKPVAAPVMESGAPLDSCIKDRSAPAFQGVTYPEPWKGITVSYERAAGGLAESVYVIQPGSDVHDIRIRYNADFSIENDGGLRFRHPTKKGYFTLSRPVAWQEIGGRKIPVEVAFTDYGDRTLGFAVGVRNPDYALIIDPTYQWHTLYGSADIDYGYGIAVTSDGVYVAGISGAAWNGDGDTPPIHGHSGSYDIVVLKLDISGAYQWHTFYGSAGQDHGYGIAVTSDGVYVTGFSDTAWNGDGGTLPIHGHSASFSYDIVVLKLDTSGVYQWHTFYGAGDSEDDYASGIAVTADGVYVSGSSNVTWNGDGNASPIHGHSGYSAIAVLKLNTSGTYQWHTFYGSSDADYGYGIAVMAGSIYVTGASDATWNGDGDTSPIHGHSGSLDIAVLKLDTSGAYLWHTFYGCGNVDYGFSIAVSADGVYVTGLSDFTWNGDENIPPIFNPGGDPGIVVVKINTSGVYQWHTFYGSQGSQCGRGIAVTAGGVYVTGNSEFTWNGDGNTSPIHGHSGIFSDIMILKLNTSGAYQWHTFYGAATSDYGYSIAVTADDIYVTGHSPDTWNGDGDTSPIHGCSGSSDIMILKLSDINTVSYDGNGATGGAPPTDGTTYHQGDTVNVLDAGSLVCDGFTFNGWNTESDGSGDSYAAGDTFTMPAADVTLYAQWTAVSPAVIPTLSEWGMIIFALLMAGMAILLIKKRDSDSIY